MTTTQVTAVGGFADLDSETTAPRELTVRGELPEWLSGSLLRTGPARWNIGSQRMRHWFDGLAMLHHFSFTGGRVQYANRFVRSKAFTDAEKNGAISYREFATDPCRSIFQRVQTLFKPGGDFTDNPNVNVGRLGDRFLAMTESAIPVQFDRDTLTTAGVAYRGPGQISTAHPHFERGTGAMLNYAVRFGARSSYRFFRVDPGDASTRLLAELPAHKPSYMHSFGMTENYFVLTEFPLVVNPASIPLSGKPFIENYRWEPERGTRFTLIGRHDGKIHCEATTDAMFAFHHVNAYEDGNDVVVDLCSASDSSIIDDLYLDRIHGRLNTSGADAATNYPHLVRYQVNTSDGTISSRQLSKHGVDLPVINHREYAQRPHRYVWGAGSAESWIDQLLKIDTGSGETRIWREDHHFPGEPIFVPRPGASGEDDGVVLSVDFDAAQHVSSLLVLDAATLTELARASVGHHIPFGFHGTFTRA